MGAGYRVVDWFEIEVSSFHDVWIKIDYID